MIVYFLFLDETISRWWFYPFRVFHTRFNWQFFAEVGVTANLLRSAEPLWVFWLMLSAAVRILFSKHLETIQRASTTTGANDNQWQYQEYEQHLLPHRHLRVSRLFQLSNKIQIYLFIFFFLSFSLCDRLEQQTKSATWQFILF